VALLLWVLIPGPAVLAIVGRSMTSGFTPALKLIAGILLGDLFYLCIALFGLAAIGKIMGEFFIIIRMAGAAYLIFLGVGLWLKGTRMDDSASLGKRPDGCKSLLAGFGITLGNPKAILFHLGFLPAFFDLSAVTASDSVLIITMFMAVLGTSLSAYAYLGSRVRGLV
jgi:threonine/homoserine/homoserine lactone efflux protein